MTLANLPEPLYKLVERWTDDKPYRDGEYWEGVRVAAKQLEAALRAWDEQLNKLSPALATVDRLGNPSGIFVRQEAVRQQVLGLPAKELHCESSSITRERQKRRQAS